MPRGVPASGKRQPRAVPADGSAEPTLADGADDYALDRFDEAVEEETPPARDELNIEAMTEVLDQRAEPVADTELSPEQRRIKDLEDQLALVSGKKDIEPVAEPISVPGDGKNIIIHFLEDGLTALGKVWYRGEELEFEVGSQAYKDTFNRRGQTWLDLRFDEFAQADRFDGKIMFRNGPWPGKTYLDGSFEQMRGEREGTRVAAPTEDELAAAEKARAKRAAPRLPAQV